MNGLAKSLHVCIVSRPTPTIWWGCYFIQSGLRLGANTLFSHLQKHCELQHPVPPEAVSHSDPFSAFYLYGAEGGFGPDDNEELQAEDVNILANRGADTNHHVVRVLEEREKTN
jgi:hypothetical protein